MHNKNKRIVSRFFSALRWAQVTGMILIASTLVAQTTNLNYKVMYNKTQVGWIKLQKVDSAETSFIKLQSEIKRRIIFLLSVTEKQEASFDEGGMTSSYIFRKVNEDVKMNKHTLFTGNSYEVKDQESSEVVMIKRIHYNLLSMYYREPVNIKQVYSDSFQRLLTIEPNGVSSYKVKLPDGNNNYYYYVNGVCSKIVVEHTLFTVEFVRIP